MSASFTLDDVRKLLDEKLQPVHDRLTDIETRMGSMETRMGSMETRMGSMETSMAIMGAKQFNSNCTREEPLKRVPRTDGTLPAASEYPPTLAHLLVAGSEKLPNGEVNSWNSQKTKKLLRLYGEDCSDSEGEGAQEGSQHARQRRLRLARTLGITMPQLNFAQLAL